MTTPKIFDSEYRFCLLLWETEPINSTELVRLCNERLGWSKATTYTVIRRLSERGIVKNKNAMVSSLVSKEEVQRDRLEEMVEETFQGSLPAFLAAFSHSKRLKKSEIDQLRQMIADYPEEDEE